MPYRLKISLRSVTEASIIAMQSRAMMTENLSFQLFITHFYQYTRLGKLGCSRNIIMDK